MKFTCTKIYPEIPFAHRQHMHKGHCAFIHGHNWSFEFTFAADRLDENGFVVDFGELKWLRDWLNERFDHALVLNDSDPELEELHLLERAGMAKILVVPNCGAEGLAGYVLERANGMFRDSIRLSLPIDWAQRGLRVVRLTIYEDSKNSATVEVQE